MRIATIDGIENFKSYIVHIEGRPELQPEIIMTMRHKGYLEYGADLVIERMKSRIMYDRFNDHTVRFAADGFLQTCVEIEFTGTFNDEQYKVIKVLIFMWYKVLFSTMLIKTNQEELLIKEMDGKYYERNIELLSKISIS